MEDDGDITSSLTNFSIPKIPDGMSEDTWLEMIKLHYNSDREKREANMAAEREKRDAERSSIEAKMRHELEIKRKELETQKLKLENSNTQYLKFPKRKCYSCGQIGRMKISCNNTF